MDNLVKELKMEMRKTIYRFTLRKRQSLQIWKLVGLSAHKDLELQTDQSMMEQETQATEKSKYWAFNGCFWWTLA